MLSAVPAATIRAPLGLTAIAALSRIARHTKPQAVEREFNALFIGLGRGELLPYASYYLTGFLNEKPLAALRRDRAAGVVPLAIVGTAGSVNTGTYDDLRALGALAADPLVSLVDTAFVGRLGTTEYIIVKAIADAKTGVRPSNWRPIPLLAASDRIGNDTR